MKRAATFVGVAALLLAGAPLVRDHEHLTLEAATSLQGGGGGGTAVGRRGPIHFELGGPAAAPLVVLVHGVSGPMAVWDKTFAMLVASGHRVLRYDLYGRGLSARPDVAYDEALFDDQLLDLLDALTVSAPVALVGSSMGCIVSAGFRNRHPDRVRRLALIGPAGFTINASPLAPLLQVPLVGTYLMRVVGDNQLMAHSHEYYVHPDRFPEAHAAFSAQLEVVGTKRAMQRTMTDMPVQDYREGYAAVGASRVPVLLLWGREDKTFPFAHHEEAQRLMPQAAFIPIDGGAHLPQYEVPAAVNEQLLAFLGP